MQALNRCATIIVKQEGEEVEVTQEDSPKQEEQEEESEMPPADDLISYEQIAAIENNEQQNLRDVV